jgi:hypothetical protein
MARVHTFAFCSFGRAHPMGNNCTQGSESLVALSMVIYIQRTSQHTPVMTHLKSVVALTYSITKTVVQLTWAPRSLRYKVPPFSSPAATSDSVSFGARPLPSLDSGVGGNVRRWRSTENCI